MLHFKDRFNILCKTLAPLISPPIGRISNALHSQAVEIQQQTFRPLVSVHGIVKVQDMGGLFPINPVYPQSDDLAMNCFGNDLHHQSASQFCHENLFLFFYY